MNAIIKHPKFMWIVGAVLVGIYFYPSFLPITSHTQQHQFPVDSKPSAGQPAAPPVATAPVASGPPALPPATAAPTGAESNFANLTGNWHGTAAIAEQGICGLKFELRADAANEGKFLGNSIFSCMPVSHRPGQPKQNPMLALLNAGQTSSILTGHVVSGAIQFHVDKTISERCAPASFTLTPFGASQLGAEWKDPVCGNGQMLLAR